MLYGAFKDLSKIIGVCVWVVHENLTTGGHVSVIYCTPYPSLTALPLQ